MKKDYSRLIVSRLQEYEQNMECSYVSFLKTKDDEALHQLRVEIRKSRAILKAFDSYFNIKALKKIDKKLSKIAKASNKTRDLDVFLDACYKEFAPFIVKLPIAFYESLVIERREERVRLEQFLKSGFVKETIFEYKLFLGKSAKPKKKKKRLLIEIESILAQHFSEINTLYRRYLDTKEEQNLHQIRINFKKIRYLLEAFKKTKYLSEYRNMAHQSKVLQERLGEFNDLCIQMVLVETYLKNHKSKKSKAFLRFMQEIEHQKKRLKKEIEPLLIDLLEGENYGE
ncbi:MAG: CHAD domain-containing protein [Epsilonproteobacteria bacterium]|nr:CHAD domain-containing protein [Campylobacterota bacterium]